MAFSLSDRSSLNTYPQNYIFLRSNPSFQPRPNEFKKLTHQLGAESNKARLTKKKRILGLIGLGGIGKSQLAAELAHQYAKEQRFPDGIFWVSMGEELGEGSIGLESLLVRLCANTEYFPPKDNIANPENNALRSRYICKYLAEHSNALLILDDVYDIEAVLGDLTAYAGTDLQCTILYTSRNSNVPAYIMAYTVPPLTPKGALHLLLERRPRMLKERNAQRQDEQEWRSARAICDYVERLPLALSILRDLLRDETLSVTHLWKELNENDVFWTMAARTNISDRHLFQTFLLSWSKIRSLEAQYLFKLVACFPGASPVPLWVLELATGLKGSTSIEPLGTARLELQDLSLLELLPNEMVRMHPLLRAFGLYILDRASERSSILQDVSHRISNEFLNITNLERRALMKGYWTCLSDAQIALYYSRWFNMEQANNLERIVEWLAFESVLLGNSDLWPHRFPSLFFQQLYHHFIDEGYRLPESFPTSWWLRQHPGHRAKSSLLVRQIVPPTHSSPVVWSPDGQRIITGSIDSIVRLWEVESGRLLHLFEGHTGFTLDIALSHDGNFLATNAEEEEDNPVRIWDMKTKQTIHILHHGFRQPYFSFAPDRNSFAILDREGILQIWDPATGRKVSQFSHRIEQNYSYLGFSPSGKFLLTHGYDSAFIWDIEEGTTVAELIDFRGYILGVGFTPDEKSVIISASLKGTTGFINRWYLDQWRFEEKITQCL